MRIATLVLVLACGRPGWADESVTRSLDRLVAMQRPAGGWVFWSEPGMRPQPFTLVVRNVERILAPLGMATWDLVVVRSPGTPAAGLALLEGYERTGRDGYREAARRAGDFVLATQLAPGGWFSEVPVHDAAMPWWFRWPAAYRPMLDDDVTPGAIRLLVTLWRVTGEARYRAGAERGIALLLRAEVPSGGWPLDARPEWLRWVHPHFEDRPAVNDGATPFVVTTLITAATALGRPELLQAARRGGEWLLAVQGKDGPGGWAQQYAVDGTPAAARAFEVPALATWETRHAIEALAALAVATGDPRFCDGARRGAQWLDAVRIGPACWARFYDPRSGRPSFADRAGHPVDRSSSAQPGYCWMGDFGIPWVLARLGVASSDAGYRIPGDPGRCPEDPAPSPPFAGARALVADAATALRASRPRTRSTNPSSPCAELAAP